MSFCYLLNAALLFAGVLGFIIAGFAGTFSRSLHGCRYRLMLGPLGFVLLGSVAHSATAQLFSWYSHVHPAFHITHPAGFGSTADVFETLMLLGSGLAGVLCGIMLGTTLDREPAADATYTIANYWNRRARTGSTLSTHTPTVQNTPKENVVAISKGRKHTAAVPPVRSTPESAVRKTELGTE